MKPSRKKALRKSVRESILGFLAETSAHVHPGNEWDDYKRGSFSGPGVDEVISDVCEKAKAALMAAWKKEDGEA